MFYVSLGRRTDGRQLPPDFNDFEVAAREPTAAYETGQLQAFTRHARIAEDQAAKFWEHIDQVIREFEQLPRAGNTVYGFTVGLYPIPDHPTLPEPRSHED